MKHTNFVTQTSHKQRKTALILCLRRYDAALNAIDDPEKCRAFIDEWQDGISSLNNIGGRAHQIADAIRAKMSGGVSA